MVNGCRQWTGISDRLTCWLFTFRRTVCCLLLVTFCLLSSAYSFPLTCQITDISPEKRSLRVNCETVLTRGKYQLALTDEFAGIQRLSERIYSLKITDAQATALKPEIYGPGIYHLIFNQQSQNITISYELRLARALDPGAWPLTSSLGPETGFLLLDDVLPRVCVAGDGTCNSKTDHVRLKIAAPLQWQIVSTERYVEGVYEISAPERAVFFLGSLRQQSLNLKGMNVQMALTGTWSFSDEQAVRLAEIIVSQQAMLMGGLPIRNEAEPFLITLAPYPIPLTGLRSSALTRHHTVVMMLNQNSDPARTFSHYARHLAHETFHYYLPGAFQIRENFDWFWEGFTRYVALVTLQQVNRISLREYLNALSDEYESYAYNPARKQLSLIAVSPEKFSNLAYYELVYRKGMLVAGLYDLELRWQSGGRNNVMDVMRELYQSYSRLAQPVGNTEVLKALRKAGSFDQFVRDYIEGTREIDLVSVLRPYGLVVERGPGNRPRISVAQKLSAKQRMLMAQLGN